MPVATVVCAACDARKYPVALPRPGAPVAVHTPTLAGRQGAFKPFGLAEAPSVTVGFRPVAGLRTGVMHSHQAAAQHLVHCDSGTGSLGAIARGSTRQRGADP